MEAIKIPAILLLLSLLFIPLIQASKAQNSTIDPYNFLHIVPNPDGSITRLKDFFPTVPPNSSTLSLSKDVPLNPDKKTWVRIYLPNGSDATRPGKLPVVVFVHGGGFIVMSSASPKFDSFCSQAADQLGAVVVSVEYRLAPEHRLPAAYDDVLEALYWIKEDEWLRYYADVSKCVLVGESAGGNIAYNVGLRVSALIDELKPLIIKGLVLIQPFFGGVKRTRSELRLVDDKVLPLVASDLLWELSLPMGATGDHVYCNPIVGGGSSGLANIRELGWPVGVVGCDGDPLFDRQVQLVKLLNRRRVNVKPEFSTGGYHGIFSDDPFKIQEVNQLMGNILFNYGMNQGLVTSIGN